MADVHMAGGGYGPKVLVIDDDPSIGRLVRIGLETEGCQILMASTLDAAGRALSDDLIGVVLDRQLPDGDGLTFVGEIRARCPEATVVLHSTLETDVVPPGVATVAKGDVAALIEALGIRGREPEARRLAIIDLVESDIDLLEEDWQELCRWDPMLPPDSTPAMARHVIVAVASALGHPQPLAWGPDPAIEAAAESFAVEAGSVGIAIEQLVCLREALSRRVVGQLPPEEVQESQSRIHMVVDRAIGVAAQRATSRLQSEALSDELTGLLNRRALDRNVRRELSRAGRYGRTFTVVVIDLDGLKRVNDTQGHAAGDRMLRNFATSVSDALRAGDSAYRLGGDEFALLLPETAADQTAAIVDRLVDAGAPPFGWGAATFPAEGDSGHVLLELADQRLYELRARQRLSQAN